MVMPRHGLFFQTKRRKWIPIKTAWLILFALILSACSPLAFKGKDNSIQYVILGFGVVTVPKPQSEVAITAAKATTLGLSISNQPGLKFSLGYSSGFFLAIPDHAKDVRLEVYERLGGPITVDTISAELEKKPHKEKNNEQEAH